MIIKISGCILIFIACLLYGHSFKLYTKKRLASLENLLCCMQVLEREVRYSMSDIISSAQKMLKVAECDNALILGSFLKRASNSEGQALSDVWQENIESNSDVLCYEKTDLELLTRFGTVLGSADVQTQLKNIDVLCDGINESIDLTKSKTSRNDDVFAKLGIYVGALLVIFLI